MAAGAPSAGRTSRRFYAGRLAEDGSTSSSADGEVLGWALLVGDELDGFYVAPEAQRRASALRSSHTSRSCAPSGFGFWVFSDNERARRFYESHGAWCLYETDGANNEERRRRRSLRVAA